MKKRFILFSILFFVFIFSGCSFIEAELSHPVEKYLGITVNVNTYTGSSGKTVYYTYVNTDFTVSYCFYPDTSLNCEDFDISFSDNSLFELVDKSVENKQFTVKALKKGTGSITMIPYPDSEYKSTSLQIEIK